MEELKGKAVRGGFAKICAQVANFVLRKESKQLLGLGHYQNRLFGPRLHSCIWSALPMPS
jgi:hypothetical protein